MLLSHRMSGQVETPSKRTIILHGVLGRKNNWGAIARALIKEDSTQQIVLVDLPLHGDSLDVPPPHTIENAGAHVAKLARELGGAHRIIGHSLGAKVAAIAADKLCQGDTDLSPESLWLIDSSPSLYTRPRSESTRVIEALREVGSHFASRQAFLDALAAQGLPQPICLWLAMNLKPARKGVNFSLDLDAIAELIADFYATELWPLLEGLATVDKHLVVGETSTAVLPSDVERFNPLGQVHHIAEAGHWVHVEQPKALLALFL